jgi:hypothetical protein
LADAVLDLAGAAFDLAGAVLDLAGAAFDLAGAVLDLADAVLDLAGAAFDLAGAVFDLAGAVFDLAGAVLDLAGAAFDLADAVFDLAGAVFDLAVPAFALEDDCRRLVVACAITSADRATDLLRLLARRLNLAGKLAELTAGLADLLADVGQVDLHARNRHAEELLVLLERGAPEQYATGHADRTGYCRDRDLRDRVARRALVARAAVVGRRLGAVARSLLGRACLGLGRASG